MYVLTVLLFLFPLCNGRADQNDTNTTDIVVGHVYRRRSDAQTLAMLTSTELAAKHVSEILGDDINIRVIQNDTGRCDHFKIVNTAFHYFTKFGVNVLLGPYCNTGMEKMATYAAVHDWPVIGYESTLEDLGDKDDYPTLARVSFTINEFGRAAADFMEQFKWKTVGYVYEERFPCGDEGFHEVFRRAARRKFHITYHTVPRGGRRGRNDESRRQLYRDTLEQVKKKARIVVVCLGDEISDAREFLIEAYNAGMMGNEYAYIAIWVERDFGRLPWEYQDDNDALMRELFSKILVVSHPNIEKMLPQGYFYDTFKPWLLTVENVTKERYNVTEPQFRRRGVQMSVIHDGMLLYGHAIKKCLKLPNCSYTSGKDMFNAMRNQVFQGASGRVVMSDTSDRLPDYIIQTFADDQWKTHFSLNFEQEFLPDGKVKLNRHLIVEIPFKWNTSDSKPPPDTPACGFEGSIVNMSTQVNSYFCYILVCKERISDLEIVIGGVIGTIFLLTVIALGMRWNNKQFERSLLAQSWRIDHDEIQKVGANFANSMKSLHSLRSVTSTQNPMLLQEDENEVRALCRGREVLMYVYPKKETVDFMKRQELLLLKELRDLQHENVNAFIGICIDENDVKTVWNYCQKEGLEDILYNNEIILDEMFKSSIVKDLIRGLHYIHQSKIGAHGHLLVRKCYVDSRWVVKISDCYIQEVMRPLLQKGAIELSHPMKVHELIEMAPEFVRSLSEVGDAPTKEADIYGLGMIFFQVIFREKPFSFNNNSEEEILKRVKRNDALIQPLFPLELEGCHPSLLTLMEHCWNEKPAERPTIQEVKNDVYRAMNKHSGNLVDHMVKIMEQYAKNLEKMVESRTKELIDERERADQLLFRMLPVSIAIKLKQGVIVEPEFFDAVTLMFTDIVGFTNICSQSTPQQVVQMMNSFYSDFDEISERFDVYKVETIGDAYMVASGLPIRNGAKHVSEIADLALTYRKLTMNKGVPHLPGQYIQTRSGIHSGPAAAGVVGLQMPHYCLFGNTVNMASRMESSGLPMKIQLSHSSKELLEQDDKYELVYRGEIDIKGKGCQSTYWLNINENAVKSNI